MEDEHEFVHMNTHEALFPRSESKTPLDRRGFLPVLVLLAGGWWGWWAAYDRAAASLRLVLWLCAIWLYVLVRALPQARRRHLPLLLAALNNLLALAALVSLPLPFDSDTTGGILAVFLPLAPRPALMILPLLALLITREYGAWIGVTAGLGVWMLAPWGARRLRVLAPTKRARLTPFVAGALSLGFLLLLGFPPLLDRLQRLPIPWQDLHTRLTYARNSLYLIADFPLGGGFASFSGLYSRYILGIAHVFISSSHNLYLDMALEQGLPALAVFLYLWSAAAVDALLQAERPHARLALVSLVVLAVHGVFEAPLYATFALPLLLLPLALAPPPHVPGAASRARMALLLLPLLLLPLQLPVTRQAQIELHGWPQTRPEQTTPEALRPLVPAYQRTLRLLPGDFASTYRLGLIAIQERDYSAAVTYLQDAQRRKPAHTGVRKALAYALLWDGQVQEALPLLRTLPEAEQDLRNYAHWWPTQGRADLAARAQEALEALGRPSPP
ncbi:MAG: hypothetical protein Fur0018_21050 [Anaerolineales bacterium]